MTVNAYGTKGVLTSIDEPGIRGKTTAHHATWFLWILSSGHSFSQVLDPNRDA